MHPLTGVFYYFHNGRPVFLAPRVWTPTTKLYSLKKVNQTKLHWLTKLIINQIHFFKSKHSKGEGKCLQLVKGKSAIVILTVASQQ